MINHAQIAMRELLDYDIDSGLLTWKWRDRKWFTRDQDWRRWNTRFAGQEFGTVAAKGYRHGRLDALGFGKRLAHRVIWFWTWGYWPECLDHIDGNPLNNRLDNLREVTNQENQKNAKRRCDNTTGVTGVHWHKATGKFQASIKVDGRKIFLGLHETLEEAAAARKDAEIKYGFHENHGRAA